MEKREVPTRVLASRLARQLTAQEMQVICGRGTSYGGTGTQDFLGRWGDIGAFDCVEGSDTFEGQEIRG
jgi:hypothetical protein